MTLHHARERIQVLRASRAADRLPCVERGVRGLHGGIDIIGRALHDRCQHAARRRFARFEMRGVFSALLPCAIDEVAVAPFVLIKPCARGAIVFRCRSVFHRGEVFGYAHFEVV